MAMADSPIGAAGIKGDDGERAPQLGRRRTVWLAGEFCTSDMVSALGLRASGEGPVAAPSHDSLSALRRSENPRHAGEIQDPSPRRRRPSRKSTARKEILSAQHLAQKWSCRHRIGAHFGKLVCMTFCPCQASRAKTIETSDTGDTADAGDTADTLFLEGPIFPLKSARPK